MNDADGGRAQSEQADLQARIRDEAGKRGWSCRFTDEWVYIYTGSSTARWALADFQADFRGTFALIGAKDRARTDAAPSRTSYGSTPWHEWDRGGRHISDKSG